MYNMCTTAVLPVYYFNLNVFGFTGLFTSRGLYTKRPQTSHRLPTSVGVEKGTYFKSVTLAFYTLYTAIINTTITDLVYKSLITNQWECRIKPGILVFRKEEEL